MLVTFLFEKCQFQYSEASSLGQFLVSFWVGFLNLSGYRFSWNHLGSSILGQTSQLVPAGAVVGLPQCPIVPYEDLPLIQGCGITGFS